MSHSDITKIIIAFLRNPGMAETPWKYTGVFRGFVEDVADPENRGRVRVRVPHVHGTDVGTASLPWAERCLPDAGGDYGDVIPLKAGRYAPSAADDTSDPNVSVSQSPAHTGDPVLVMFEGGDVHMPIVIGLFNPRGDGPREALPSSNPGFRRRRILKSRHGTRVEFGDERDNLEWKVTTPTGHVIQMREAEGGRGIHVTTQGGHTLSLQDESPGDAAPVSLRTPYDNTPDSSFAMTADGGDRENPIALPPTPTPDGVPKSPTPGVGIGFGRKGVTLRTSGGHKIDLSDSGNFIGATVQTAHGHNIVLRDAGGPVGMYLTTYGGNNVSMTDGVGVVVHSQWGQEMRMTPTDFGLFWNDMEIRFGVGLNRWYIVGNLSIQATGDVEILSGNNMDITAVGMLTETGLGGRTENPPIPPP